MDLWAEMPRYSKSELPCCLKAFCINCVNWLGLTGGAWVALWAFGEMSVNIKLFSDSLPLCFYLPHSLSPSLSLSLYLSHTYTHTHRHTHSLPWTLQLQSHTTNIYVHTTWHKSTQMLIQNHLLHCSRVLHKRSSITAAETPKTSQAISMCLADSQ